MANSDWEIVDNDANSKSQIANPSDWEIVPEETSNQIPQESIGTSLALAIPRVATDVAKGAYNIAQNIPNYYREAATQAPLSFVSAGLNPQNAFNQVKAGLNQGINQIAQFPAKVANYIGPGRLNLLPSAITNAINYATPPNTSNAINAIYGEGNAPGDQFIRSVSSLLPQIAIGSELEKAIEPSQLIQKISPSKGAIKNTILNTHDALENDATTAFNNVSKGVNERGITQVPIDSEFINGLKGYFANTTENKAMINDAATGNYNALRDLQSDLYKEGKNNLGSDQSSADRKAGAEMLEKRNIINQAISDHLMNTGNIDLNNILNKARSDWGTLQRTYYNEYMPTSIINMVNKNYRKIPNNLIDVLQEDSKPMQALRNFHPGLQDALNKYGVAKGIAKNAFKASKIVVPYAGIGIGGYEIGKALGSDYASH